MEVYLEVGVFLMEDKKVLSVLITLLFVASIAVGAFVVSLAGSASTGGGSTQASVHVYIQNYNYIPNDVRIAPGTTVTWTNNDSMDHTVTSQSSAPAPFDSGVISQGHSFSFTFTTPGTYPYYCKIHPFMHGNVTVLGNGSNSAAIHLQAQNIKFNLSSISVPAGSLVTVFFKNLDSGTPHNFAVYDSSAAATVIFKGTIITGVASTTYTFTAPTTPGTYFFRCDVHPTIMFGNFIVTPSGSQSASQVVMENNSYQPEALTVTPGTTVEWTNKDSVNHTVTTTSGPIQFDSGTVLPNGTFSQVFLVPGTYVYHSVNDTGMQGNITVNGPPSFLVNLTAQNYQFDKSSIYVPAGQNISIFFKNLDQGVAHNFALYGSSSLQVKIFQGADITGVASTLYTFKAPSSPGLYFFRCDVQPNLMFGSFIVT